MLLELTLASRYLWGRKLRTFLTTLAVMFGVLVIFAMNILIPTLLEAFQGNLRAASHQVDVTVSLKTGESFASSVLRKVKGIEGVQSAAGSLNRMLNVPDNFFSRSAGLSALALVGIDPVAAQTVRDYPLKQGRFLRADDTTAALITLSLAEQLALNLGDTLALPTADGTVKLKVAGLLPARTLPGNEEVLVALSEAQKLLDLPDRINTIEANFDSTDPARRAATQQALEQQLGKNYQLGALSSGGELLASFQTGQTAFNVLGVMALLMGGFIIFNTFRTIVAERRHDIGMLRAVGAGRGTILGMILFEGVLQGVLGTLAGLAVGYLLGAGLLSLLSPLYAQFLHIKTGAPVIVPAGVVVSVVLGVGVTLAAGLLPALSASRVTPLEALRPSFTATINSAGEISSLLGAGLIGIALIVLFSKQAGLLALGGLALLIGLVMVAPALIRPIAVVFGALLAVLFAGDGTSSLAEGNLTRQTSRAAVTASAMMIGIAIIVALSGMISSLNDFTAGIMQKTLGSDYLLVPPSIGTWSGNVGASRGLADKLREVRGVGEVSSMRYAATTVNGKAVSLLAIDPVIYPRVSGLDFLEGNPAAAYAALGDAHALIINGVLAANLGAKAGDSVRLATPDGEQEYRVAAVAGDYFNFKIMTAYISQANLEAQFHKSEDVFVQVNLAPGADSKEVKSRLLAIVRDYPQFHLIEGKTYRDDIAQQTQSAYGVLYILLGVLAVPSLIALLNTLAIGVIERTREIGMLRAIGATRAQVQRMVVAESLLLAGIGTAIGLVAGLYLGDVIVVGLSAAGLRIPYSFPAAGVLSAVATGLFFGVLAAIVPARQAARLEIIRALRYE